MSDWSGKHRPLLERIACMRGRSAGLVISYGGGAPQLTDLDIAAAVGYSRTHDSDHEEIAPTVRPELLQLHYAGMGEFVYRITRAAWNGICKGVEKADGPMYRRGCLLAAESMGGKPLVRDVVEHEAWLIARRREDLEKCIARAGVWLQAELYDGAGAYIAFLSRLIDERKEQAEIDRKARQLRRENRRAISGHQQLVIARKDRERDEVAQAIAAIDARKRTMKIA